MDEGDVIKPTDPIAVVPKIEQNPARQSVAERPKPMEQAKEGSDPAPDKTPKPVKSKRISEWFNGLNHNGITALFTVGIFVATATYAVFAIKQWNAMRESNAINRENVESVQRALVFFSGQPAYVKRLTGKKVTSLTIVLPWENTGVTPAMNGKSIVNWKTFPSPSGLPENFTYPDEVNVEPRQFEIPPRGYGNGTMDVPIQWIEATKNGSLRMFIHGWIIYDDIFKGTEGTRKTPIHLSEFCDEITNIKSTPDDVTDPTANITWELSLCREHNCSDERCRDYQEKTR
jgi:hypothetical protein